MKALGTMILSAVLVIFAVSSAEARTYGRIGWGRIESEVIFENYDSARERSYRYFRPKLYYSLPRHYFYRSLPRSDYGFRHYGYGYRSYGRRRYYRGYRRSYRRFCR